MNHFKKFIPFLIRILLVIFLLFIIYGTYKLSSQAESIRIHYKQNYDNLANDDTYKEFPLQMQLDFANLEGEIKSQSMQLDGFYSFTFWVSISLIVAIVIEAIILKFKTS